MKDQSANVRFATLSYAVWSILLIISASNAVLWHSFFANSVGLLFGLGVAAVAIVLLMVESQSQTRKLRQLATIVLLLFGMSQIGGWIGAMSVVPPLRGLDFAAYYVAVRLVAEHPRENPYGNTIEAGSGLNQTTQDFMYPRPNTPAGRFHVPYAMPFIYPTLTAVLMKPLAKLSFDSAYGIWKVVSVLVLIIATLLTLDLGGIRITLRLLLIVGVGLFSFYPVLYGLLLGQIGCFILFFLTTSVWMLARKGVALSAFSYALATMIKLTPVVALPVLVFHRKWKWLLLYGASLLALALFSIWQAGWSVNRQFVDQVLPSLSGRLPIGLNISLPAFIQELFLGYVPKLEDIVMNMPVYAHSVSKGVAAAVYGWMLLRFWKGRHTSDLTRDLSLMALLAISISPLSWWHHYTVALLPFLYLWCKLRDGEGAMLATLVLVVGTNVVGFAQLLTSNHIAQLILSAVVPLLTIAFVYTYSAPARQPESTGHDPVISVASPA